MFIFFLLSLSVYKVQICPIYAHVIRKNFSGRTVSQLSYEAFNNPNSAHIS